MTSTEASSHELETTSQTNDDSSSDSSDDKPSKVINTVNYIIMISHMIIIVLSEISSDN